MFGLDENITEIGSGGGLVALVVVAALLGLRHATDPDHLAALSVLVAGDEEHGVRQATRLGLAWGAGHATTIILFGVPIVLVDAYLPEAVQIGSETLIGVLIMVFSVRLLLRWRRSGLHAHRHEHDGGVHVHLHAHERVDHHHRHTTRSAHASYGIGLVHGVAGSAGVGILLLAAIPDEGAGLVALLIFAAFTSLSMAVASTVLGHLLVGERSRGRFTVAMPVLGVLNLAFGAWYALGALG